MKTELIDVSPTQKRIVFEIPADIVAAEFDRVTRDYTRQARLPGFRPGKAPTRLVRQQFADRIRHDALHDLIPRSVSEAVREHSLEPVDTPDIRDVAHNEGEALTFTALVETLPPIPPIDYASLRLTRAPIAVADEAITAMLTRLAERQARVEPVADRASREGDTLTVDLTRKTLSSPKDEQAASLGKEEAHTDLSIEIGAAFNPPGFDGHIVGLQAGETKTFVIAFPPDYQVDELQGAQVEYTVAVKGIKEKVLPAIDDEFAKDMGDFASLDALRERIRTDMQREAERNQERELRSELLRQLAAHVTIDVPESMVHRELDRRLEEFVRRLMDQGVDPMKANINWDEFRTEQRPMAIDTVKSAIVLDDVARREDVSIGGAELDEELGKYATASGRSVSAVRARLEEDGGLGRLATGMRRDKTVEYLMSRATIQGA